MSDHPAGIETPDTHASVKPHCPVCGAADLSGLMDDPDTARWHYLSGPCPECDAYLSVEMVAVDVWYSIPDECPPRDSIVAADRSAVSDGLVPVQYVSYLASDDQRGEMPPAARERFAELWGTEYPTPDDAEASD